MSTSTVAFFYDFICPFCYINHKRTELLGEGMDVSFRWHEWETYPETVKNGAPWPDVKIKIMNEALKPWAKEVGLAFKIPSVQANSNLALRGSFYAKKNGIFEGYQRAVYSAYWVENRNIGELRVLTSVANRLKLDAGEFVKFIRSKKSARQLAAERAKAKGAGIELVPIFLFGSEELVGNKSYSTVKECLENYVKKYPVDPFYTPRAPMY